MNMIKKYWDTVYIYLLLFSPTACICAGIYFTICKMIGLYKNTSWVLLILFDLSQFIYLMIAFYFIRKRKKQPEKFDHVLSDVKKYISISLFIQYNFIMHLFYSEYVWSCTFIFLILIVFYFDVRMMIINTSVYILSLTAAYILHYEQHLGMAAREYMHIIIFKIIVILLCSLLLIALTFFMKKFLETTTKEENEKQYLIEKQLEYYERLGVMDSELRKFRHDIQNHFLCMQSLIKHNNYTELQTYFDELLESYANKDLLYFSGNIVIDSILNYHLGNLDITPVIYGKLPEIRQVSSMDLCTIFSNMLSNAVNAVRLCSNSKRSILVRFDFGKKYFLISITNSFHPNLPADKKPADIRNHGYGLNLIKETVNKYQGVFEQNAHNEKITTTIYLPI